MEEIKNFIERYPLLTNGMRDDLAAFPEVAVAMMELLSSGFSIKMNGKGSGMFVAKKSKYEFRVRFEENEPGVDWDPDVKGDFQRTHHVVFWFYFIKPAGEWEKIIEGKLKDYNIYNFEVDRGDLKYDEKIIASYSKSRYGTGEPKFFISRIAVEKIRRDIADFKNKIEKIIDGFDDEE